ncbi:CHAT domain-containing protein [Nitrosococcus wardiae]|nr:CHAT domain-containing protein [Nitrosococcus wardiae]
MIEHLMQRWLSRLVIFLGGFLILLGCQSTAFQREQGKAQEAEILVRPNLVGEKCRVQPATYPDFADQTEQIFQVFCGRWEHPSGRLYQVASSASLETWTSGGWWREVLEQRMLCEQEEPATLLEGVEARLLQCRLRNGGWPYIALAARINGSTFLADGIPALLRVLEESIGFLSGQVELKLEEEGTVSAAIQRLEAQLADRMYGAGDLQVYYQLMTAGQYYNSIKDFVTAANRYREALALHERLLGLGNPETLDPVMHLALELSNQQRFTEAEALFERVSTIAKQALDQADYARYLSYRGFHAANQRQFKKALELARQATKLRRELASRTSVFAASERVKGGQTVLPVGQRADMEILHRTQASGSVDMVQSLSLEAAMLHRLGKAAQAEKVLQEANEILLAAQEVPPTWEPELLRVDAEIAASQEVGGERQQHLSTAVTLWGQIAPRERPGAVTYLELGKAYREQGRLDEAMTAFRRGIKLLKNQNGSLRFEQLQPYLKTAFEVAQAQPAKRPALYAEMFEAGQLVRSGQTIQDIARAAARLAASEGHAGEVIRAFQEAQDERHLLYRAYEAEVAQPEARQNRERLKALSAELVEINQRIRKLSEQVQAAFPRYNQVIDTVTNTDRVLELIEPHEALVQVLLGDTGGFLFLAHHGKVSAHPLELSIREAALAVEELRSKITPQPDGGLPAFDVVRAHQLYQELFSSVAKQIKKVEHLITVPSGPLLSLPFGLLVTETPPSIENYDYTKVKWLAQRSALSLVPSVRSFIDLRVIAQPSKAPKAFAGFNNFIPYTADEVAQIDVDIPEECLSEPERLKQHRQMLLRLGSLPMTESEIQEVAKTFPPHLTDLFLGREFTEGIVRTLPLSTYRIVYFATHALLPAELSCQPEPSLVASLSQPLEAGEDGLIDTSEVYKLELDADLVVLSACNTGGPGTQTGGESLSGLARAFFFSGARSLLVSHWVVEDVATKELMTRLFEHMREMPTTGWSEALRSAQLSLIKDAREAQQVNLKEGDQNIQQYWSHPFFWAAFTLVGDGARGVVDIL